MSGLGLDSGVVEGREGSGLSGGLAQKLVLGGAFLGAMQFGQRIGGAFVEEART